MSSVTITYPGAVTPITPVAVDGYEAGRESGTVLHPIAGRESPDVTLAPSSLRSGTLRLIFGSESDARTAEDAHALPTAFTLTSVLGSLAMYYVTTGTPRRILGVTRKEWVLEVPFQEVAP